MSFDRPANRLAGETSPYLLQHAHNPVDWYPWGQDAFEKARSEDKPVFLSIGYSACHWCHVMERESFENDEIAAMLNRDFVSVKVDREERPDIDSIYMQAVQMMTGHGGWPMSMFLTPEGVPFFGGTYFPPDDSRGMPAFPRVLSHVANLYRSRRGDVDAASAEMKEAIDRSIGLEGRAQPVTRDVVDGAAMTIASSYDRVHGGFGSAPKFPPAMTLEFLLALAARGTGDYRDVILTTLRKMARGGVYDQIGGGFHRYSVDARWLVPHFEKMLYDNALLARLYVHAWQWTGDAEFGAVVRETLGFVEREMMSPEGGFYSTLDADSEGEEGKFYVWSRGEVLETLGEQEGGAFCALYDITEHGNFEGHNIPNVPRDPEAVAGDLGISRAQLDDIASRGRCKLFGRRAERVRPGRDEKVLAGWNGWMLAAFAEASLATGGRYAAVVARSADFLVDRMMEGPRLFRSYKDGQRKIGGLLEDYAGVAWGLVHAFEATQQLRYLDAARTLALQILERFLDPRGAVFFDTPSDHERLITRPKDLFDNATPSGNSLAISALFKLAVYYADETFERVARAAVEEIIPLARRFPTGFGFLLSAADWSISTPKEIAITGDAADPLRNELLAAAGATYIPHRVLATSLAPSLPLMADKKSAQALAYVCEHYACQEPTGDAARLKELLRM